ncbi:MAG TPA: DUF72 domain-containing protein [Vicinamibacterales bacterium]|nr:DUF72 domain-containing protein [Vicinamibacterales bacterium]
MTDQLSLFAPPDDDNATGAAGAADAVLAARRAHAAAVAAQLPPALAFGTSSWTFPGWTGLVYPSGLSAAALGREGLRHYARYPLLRTVGIDRSYYAPIPLDDLRSYAAQLPDGFTCCVKAPAAVTSRLAPGFGGSGSRSGRAALNPDFLAVPRLVEDLLTPLAVGLGPHTGPIVLEFPPGARDQARPPAAFVEALDRFLEALPRDFAYAVEIRDRALLTPAYHAVLARHGVAHTYNYWSAMPMPLAHAEVVPPETLPFSVVRLLLRPGTWYEDRRDRFRPFNRLVEPDEAMRDEVVALTTRALAKGRKVYVLVNNKAEGSSPLTVDALAERVAAALAAPSERR